MIEAALARFGCCLPDEVEASVAELLEKGRSTLSNGHRIRMVAFGTGPGGTGRGVDAVVPLGRVVEFLGSYLDEHWEVLRHAQFKDDTLGFLAVMEKARRG